MAWIKLELGRAKQLQSDQTSRQGDGVPSRLPTAGPAASCYHCSWRSLHRSAKAGSFWIQLPGDYATFNSKTPDGKPITALPVACFFHWMRSRTCRLSLRSALRFAACSGVSHPGVSRLGETGLEVCSGFREEGRSPSDNKYLMLLRELLSETGPLVTTRTEFRNRLGVLIGTTEVASDSDPRINARDRNGRLVGWYEIRNDVTRDWNGVKLGTGNLLSSLFLTFTRT
jgi:hypothetical protein